MERIVFLERNTIQANFRRPDFDHEWIEYGETFSEQVVERLHGATIAISNKLPLRKAELSQLPDLKLIAIAATGSDNIDLHYCRVNGIAVSNTRGYAVNSVPEHVLMMVLTLRRNLLAYGSAWNQGFLEGVMIAFLPLHLIGLGMTENAVGWLTSLTVVGVLLFQMPVAWLADRLGRTAVLLGCYALVVLGLGALPACTPSLWLAMWLFVVGACSGAFYPLGLALLGERLPDSALARANAWYLAIECAGCMAGPVAAGCARDWFGVRAMFIVGQAALVIFLLVSLGLYLLDRRSTLKPTGCNPWASSPGPREAA